MLIPNKFSGYQAGIRLYPGGGGAGDIGGVNPINPPTTPQPPPPTQPAQPAHVYQPQYQNYNTGNSMNVSQYGQQPSYGGGEVRDIFAFGGAQQPQTNWQTGQVTQPVQQQPSMFGGQMQGGGYGEYGMNNPFSPYSNSFLNLDQSLGRASNQEIATTYRNAIQNGFTDQQVRGQTNSLFGPQTQQGWGNMQAEAMGLTPSVGQGSEQGQVAFYQNARNQGFSDQIIRDAANQVFRNPSQSYWSNLQNQAGYGGGYGGYGGGFMPQMQTPFSYQQPMQQAQPTPQRTSSGPSQAIVGRSSQMRGTPNVMRRAEGGITSLMDDVA